MKTQNYLITHKDGTVFRIQNQTSMREALAMFQQENPLGEAVAIDLLETKNETPELVKARKGKKHPSRSDRFSDAQGKASEAKAEAEELRDELQNWLDNMPENKQGGQKASELEDAISALEEFIDAMDTAEGVSVDFPGMFG